jgi:hypothetical protein
MHPVWIAFMLVVAAVPQLLSRTQESSVSTTAAVPVAPPHVALGPVASPLGTLVPAKPPYVFF